MLSVELVATRGKVTISIVEQKEGQRKKSIELSDIEEAKRLADELVNATRAAEMLWNGEGVNA